jgi:hypothetical protein
MEAVAALLGALVGSLLSHLSNRALGASQLSRTEHRDARDAVVRLTEAVEHIAHQLEGLHEDIKCDRRETYGRIGLVEQRLSKLESHCSPPPACP